MTAHVQHVGRPRRGYYRGGKPTKQMGLNHLGEDLAPVRGALPRVPDACPRCENRVLRHYPGAPEVSCLPCGWEALLEPPRTAHGPAWR